MQLFLSEGMGKERHLQQLQATVRSLKQVSEDYAGYYQGVREVLKHKSELPGVGEFCSGTDPCR